MTLLAFVLCACTSPEPARTPAAAENRFAQAATAPLNDLNVVRAEIPAVLAAAQKAPYEPPSERSCAVLTTEVMALDAVLGADLDLPATPNNAGLVERGSSAVGNVAADALRSAAEGLIPFRSWVRKLSGAERYSKEVAAAIAAGTVRRSFLKGMGLAIGCQAPAAPLR